MHSIHVSMSDANHRAICPLSLAFLFFLMHIFYTEGVQSYLRRATMAVGFHPNKAIMFEKMTEFLAKPDLKIFTVY